MVHLAISPPLSLWVRPRPFSAEVHLSHWLVPGCILLIVHASLFSCVLDVPSHLYVTRSQKRWAFSALDMARLRPSCCARDPSALRPPHAPLTEWHSPLTVGHRLIPPLLLPPAEPLAETPVRPKVLLSEQWLSTSQDKTSSPRERKSSVLRPLPKKLETFNFLWKVSKDIGEGPARALLGPAYQSGLHRLRP